MTARGVTCSFARKTALDSARRGTEPRGWSCLGSRAETFCARGSAEAVARLESDTRRLPSRKYVRAKGLGVVASAARLCKNVILRQGPGGGGVYNGTKALTAIGTSCATARRVARIRISSGDSSQPNDSPPGFRCVPHGKGVRCKKGNRSVTWRWYYSRARTSAARCAAVSGSGNSYFATGTRATVEVRRGAASCAVARRVARRLFGSGARFVEDSGRNSHFVVTDAGHKWRGFARMDTWTLQRCAVTATNCGRVIGGTFRRP